MGMVNGEELGQDREEKFWREYTSYGVVWACALQRHLASAALRLLSLIPFKLSANNNLRNHTT